MPAFHKIISWVGGLITPAAMNLPQGLGIVQTGPLPYLGGWTYFIVALLSGIQGPIIILLGASMAASGLLNPEGVFLAASLGDLLFDLLWYFLGRAGKIEWLLTHWLRPHRKRIERLQVVIHRHAVKILILAKLTDGFVLPTMIAMGIVRVPWKRWIAALVAVEIFRTGSLVLIGYHAARTINQVVKGLSYLAFVGSFLVLLGVGYTIYRALNLGKRFDRFVDGEDKTRFE